jgi:hypothetical protein
MPPKVVTLKRLLHRQAHTTDQATLKQMQRQKFVWFALVPNYGESYGKIQRIYRPTRPLRLLDLSTMAMRRVIAHELGVDVERIHPDEQYSGGGGNHLVHVILEPLLQTYSLDGTIIDSARADEECGGPTEVVLRGSCVRYVNRVFT